MELTPKNCIHFHHNIELCIVYFRLVKIFPFLPVFEGLAQYMIAQVKADRFCTFQRNDQVNSRGIWQGNVKKFYGISSAKYKCCVMK